MVDPPQNLIINLKRFQSGGMGGLSSFSKNSKRVTFPLILSMDEFVIHKIDKNDEELN